VPLRKPDFSIFSEREVRTIERRSMCVAAEQVLERLSADA